jgi:hypothetical protein
MGIFFRIMCKKNHDCRSFFDGDIKFQSIYFKIEQNSSEIYNCGKNHSIKSKKNWSYVKFKKITEYT